MQLRRTSQQRRQAVKLTEGLAFMRAGDVLTVTKKREIGLVVCPSVASGWTSAT